MWYKNNDVKYQANRKHHNLYIIPIQLNERELSIREIMYTKVYCEFKFMYTYLLTASESAMRLITYLWHTFGIY